MSAIEIPQGTQAPVALSVSVNPADPSLDLTTVSAVVFQVLRDADGQTAMWTATIESATSTQLMANYIFAPGGTDFPVLGPYHVTPILTVPGGYVTGTVVEVFVVPPSRFRYPAVS